MVVRIRDEKFHLTLPVPLALAGAAIRIIPARCLEDSIEGMDGESFKKMARALLREFRGMAREFRGLEIVRVERSDGTLISVKL